MSIRCAFHRLTFGKGSGEVECLGYALLSGVPLSGQNIAIEGVAYYVCAVDWDFAALGATPTTADDARVMCMVSVRAAGRR